MTYRSRSRIGAPNFDLRLPNYNTISAIKGRPTKLRAIEQMIALKDNLGSEFVERVRGFFSENGWPSGRARRAMDRSAICRLSPIQKFGRRCAVKRIYALKRPVARIRGVSISRPANVCSQRT